MKSPRLVLAVLLLSSLGFGQAAKFMDTVLTKTSTGVKVVPYAQIRLCVNAAPSPPGAPCQPLATLYADQSMTVSGSNPVYADAKGNYSFYAAPNYYRRQILVNGVVADDQSIMVGLSNTVPDPVNPMDAVNLRYFEAHGGGGGGAAGLYLVAESDIQDTIANLPASGGQIRLKQDYDYAITCGVNQVNTGAKPVQIIGSGETSVISGSGCALVTLAMDGSSVQSLKIKQTAAHADTVGVLVASGSSREVVRWAIRDVFFDSEGNLAGSAIKTVFGLEGLVHGGETRGWNCGVELTSYDSSHRSNANSFVAFKARWGHAGFCVPANAVDNVFIASSVIEGNDIGISASSGTVYTSQSHYENKGGTNAQVEIDGDARLISNGNFYGTYPAAPGSHMDIRTSAANASPHVSYADILNGGITHNNTTSAFLVDSPIVPVATAGAGTVITRDATHNQASNASMNYLMSGFAQFDLRSPLVNNAGNLMLTAADGRKVIISNNTQANPIAEFDPADQSTLFRGNATSLGTLRLLRAPMMAILDADTLTDNRTLKLPNENGILATQAYVQARTPAQPVDVGITYNGKPAAGLTLVRHSFPFSTTVPQNCTSSNLFAEIAASANATFTLQKCTFNSGTVSCSNFGTAVIGMGAKSASFTCAAATTFTYTSALVFDFVKVLAPTPQDATLADVGGTIYGTR